MRLSTTAGVLLLAMAVTPAMCQFWSEWDVGATFLQVWPSARSSALSGAMAALTDDPEAAYWNPGALAFADRPQVLASAQSYLPGLYPGMYYTYATANVPLPERWLSGHNLTLGLNNTWFQHGHYDAVNDSGRYIGTLPMYDQSVGIQAATRIRPWLGLGLDVRYIYQSAGEEGWMWIEAPSYDASQGVTADAGALAKPWRPLSVGLTLADLGPPIRIQYHGYQGDWIDTVSPPTTVRIGLCYSPEQDKNTARVLCPRFMAQVDKVLVGMFSDPNHNLSVAQKLDSEWRSTWKAVGVELTFLRLMSARIGYFEDMANARGGIVLTNKNEYVGYSEHVTLTDAIFKPHPGEVLTGIGLTWGGGISYRNFQLDLSSDALVYDYPTADLMLSLSYRF